ncbi:MAG: serine/threonine protein kinase [Myxococcales bacterium]|nr:serine/threonine protein kinase [Myxococcales bacterium]
MSSSSLHRTQALPTPHKEKSGGSGGRAFGRAGQENPWWEGLLGQQIDRWEVLEVLGQGGMSVVFKGQHQWLDRQAAIKMLAPEFTFDDATQERFQQEARTLSRFDHPHILKILDFGLDPEHGYFMILELLQGQDLRGWMRNAPIPKERLMGIFSQICEALHLTHQAGVVHRDLKPSNLFLVGSEDFPHLKILDFGVAKLLDLQRDKQLTTTGMIMGTPAYLAPEQLKSKARLSPATDIYALGVILFEALCGRLPINGDDTLEHAMMVMSQEPPKIGEIRPVLKGSLMESFLSQLLEKDPKLRPQDIPTFWEKLRQAFLDFEDPLSNESLRKSLGKEPKAPNLTLPLALQETYAGDLGKGASVGLLSKINDSEHLTRKLRGSDGDLPQLQRINHEDLPKEPLQAPDVSAFLSLGSSPESGLRKTPAPSADRVALFEGLPSGEMSTVGEASLAEESFVNEENASASLREPSRKPAWLGESGSPASQDTPAPTVPASLDDDDVLASQSSKRWGIWAGGGFLVVVAVLVAWWMRPRVENTSKIVQSPRKKAPSKRVVVDRLPTLLEAAEKATQSQESISAVVAWKALIRELEKQKEPRYPQAWLQLSQVYEKMRWYHAAAFELQRYVALVEKSPALLKKHSVAPKAPAKSPSKSKEPREDLASLRERLARLQAQVKKQRLQASPLFATFRGHLENERWLLAQAAYKRISLVIPSVPSFHLELGRLLQAKLPSLAVWHMERYLRFFALSSREKREGESLLRSAKITQQQKVTAFRKELASIEEKAKAGKLSEAKTQLVQAFEEDKPFRFKCLRDVWQAWMQGLMVSAPRFVLIAWERHEQELGRLREQGLWSWVKLESPNTPSIDRIREQLSCLRSHHQFAVAAAEVEAGLQEGKFRQAQEQSKKAEQAWRQFVLLDAWEFSKLAMPAHKKMQAQRSILARGASLEKDLSQAIREGRFKKSIKIRGVLLLLIKGMSAQESMEKNFQLQDEREQKLSQLLRSAEGAYRRKRWKEAHQAYRSYLRKVPGAWNRGRIKQRIKSCGCALGYPWVTCRKSDFPR